MPKFKQKSADPLAAFPSTDWKVATRKAEWVKVRLRKAIRDEVSQYTDTDEEIEEGIRQVCNWSSLENKGVYDRKMWDRKMKYEILRFDSYLSVTNSSVITDSGDRDRTKHQLAALTAIESMPKLFGNYAQQTTAKIEPHREA